MCDILWHSPAMKCHKSDCEHAKNWHSFLRFMFGLRMVTTLILRRERLREQTRKRERESAREGKSERAKERLKEREKKRAWERQTASSRFNESERTSCSKRVNEKRERFTVNHGPPLGWKVLANCTQISFSERESETARERVSAR